MREKGSRMEHKSLSMADQIFDRLENDILTGTYARGEILTELGLSEALQVSRTPVREAICRLAQENLVEMASRGARVVGISAEDMQIIYEMRIRIEGMAARLACRAASEEDLREMKECLDLQEFYCTRKDAANIRETDSRFHALLYRASGSVHLSSVLSELHRKTMKYREASITHKSRAALSQKEHVAIYEAIAARDQNRAEAMTVLHVTNARDSILEEEKDHGTQPC